MFRRVRTRRGKPNTTSVPLTLAGHAYWPIALLADAVTEGGAARLRGVLQVGARQAGARAPRRPLWFVGARRACCWGETEKMCRCRQNVEKHSWVECLEHKEINEINETGQKRKNSFANLWEGFDQFHVWTCSGGKCSTDDCILSLAR